MTAVLFVAEAGTSALPHYRAHLPAQGLRARGWSASVTTVMAQSQDRRLRSFDPVTGKNGPVPSVVVCRHLKDPTGAELDSTKMFGEAIDKGQRVFYDLDDDYWALPAHNPAADTWTGEALAVLDRNLAAATGVLCSTAPLARAAAEHTDTPVYVARNGVDVARYHPRPADRSPLRLGWLGLTGWRSRDLTTIAPILEEMCARHAGKVELHHLGDHPDHQPIEQALGIAKIAGAWPVPIVKHRWVSIDQLPSLIAEIDAAIIPMRLDDDDLPLNSARSATTGLALAAGAVPYVASPNDDYGELATRGVGWLARQPEQWAFYLDWLLNPACDRLDIGLDWRAQVEAMRGPKIVAGDWERAFRAATP